MKRWKNLIVAGLVSTLALGAIAAVPTVVTYVGAIRGWVYVDDFGAKPNGVDDATQAYTDAVNLLKRMHGGGKVHFGSGVYKLLNAPLVEGVSIHGVGMRSGFGSKGVTTLKHGDPTAGGSMFRVTCEGTTAKGYTDLDITINASTDVIATFSDRCTEIETLFKRIDALQEFVANVRVKIADIAFFSLIMTFYSQKFLDYISQTASEVDNASFCQFTDLKPIIDHHY